MAQTDTEKQNEQATKQNEKDAKAVEKGNDPVDSTPSDDDVQKSLDKKSDGEVHGTDGPPPAELRARVPGSASTQGGLMDNLSRRSVHDALEGHFVNIDLNFDGVEDAYKAAGLEGHEGGYGIYVQPGDCDPETGIPVTAQVRLRDETNARVAVPYDALRPADARGR